MQIDGERRDEASVTIAVPCERVAGEQRVALIPEVVQELTQLGVSVLLESGAGSQANFDDEAYSSVGAHVETDLEAIYARASVVAKVQPPLLDEVPLLRPGCLLLSFLDPFRDAAIIEALRERGVTAFSFNAVPRTTRAQSMDAMSSMSTVGGYKAVLLAADALGRFFPLLMTAAGTIPPARVVVIGAGVAGLQALATARRLGAMTAGCDARPAAREQIESVGARVIDMAVETTETAGGYAQGLEEEILRQERDAIRDAIEAADVVISTAQVPGAKAPILIDEAMIQGMRAGSVIVDLAAEGGGNCELTKAGETITAYGVSIMGPVNLPSRLPVHASQLYARNVLAVLKHVIADGRLQLDPDDAILAAACLTGVPAAPANEGMGRDS